MEYRKRVYSNYVSLWQGQSKVFNEAAAVQWGKSYNYFLRRILPKDKSATILDVACGGGNLLHYLRSKGFTNIRGVDLSPEQVWLARQVVDDVALQDCINYLIEHPNQFDLIIGLDIIEHFTKDEMMHFLDSIRIALRPNARLVLQTPNLAGLMGTSMRFGDITHEIGVTPGSLENLLRIAGFGEYEAWECGPAPHGLISFMRYLLWHIIRVAFVAYDFVEVGGNNYSIYTRVFLASAVKE